jgi:hypothetical protein
VLVETFIRKLLPLKAHRVTAVQVGPEQIVVEIDRLDLTKPASHCAFA